MAHTSYNPTLSDNLRTLMKERGLRPRSLSLKAGLNDAAVRDILHGRSRSPRYDTIQSLSEVLRVRPSVLMGEGRCNENAKLDSPDISIRMNTMLGAIEQLYQAAIQCSRHANHIRPVLSPLEADTKPPVNVCLSQREREVLSLMAIGKTNDIIGRLLGISEHTVGMHVRHIYKKLEANNRSLAVVKAVAHGIVDSKGLLRPVSSTH